MEENNCRDRKFESSCCIKCSRGCHFNVFILYYIFWSESTVLRNRTSTSILPTLRPLTLEALENGDNSFSMESIRGIANEFALRLAKTDSNNNNKKTIQVWLSSRLDGQYQKCYFHVFGNFLIGLSRYSLVPSNSSEI